jgi:diguanylate cyclase (GGDEF)-like protein
MSENLHTNKAHQQPAADASVAGFSRLLEDEIARYQSSEQRNVRRAAPWFPPALEARFEEDTGAARVRDLRFAMVLGSVFYFSTVLMDPVFVPDLGWGGLWLRALALPFMAIDLLYGSKASSPVREGLLTLTACVVVTILAVIPAISSDPFAPFAFATAIFAVVYANTTVVLRFRIACAFTLYCVAAITAMLLWREGGATPLALAITLQVVIASAFSLIANYRIEWSARLSYLLGSREAMRLTALAADRETFKTLSSTDELTQLANRGAFNRACAAELAAPSNQGIPATLLMIDVDHFKRYNDHYGHLAGDQCLRAVARRISDTVRSANDVVARYGGEEFVVFSCGIGSARATHLAERICEAVSDLALPHENRDDGAEHVTISVGVASTTIGAGCSLEQLIRSADRGLYAAKRGGRNRVEPAPVSSAA